MVGVQSWSLETGKKNVRWLFGESPTPTRIELIVSDWKTELKRPSLSRYENPAHSIIIHKLHRSSQYGIPTDLTSWTLTDLSIWVSIDRELKERENPATKHIWGI